MAWISLILAGCCEIFGVIMMNRYRQKKDNLLSIIFLIACFGVSFSFLTIAMQTLPMGTAYAIWTGIGVVGGALVGMFFYGEKKDWRRVLFITMVLSAAVGLKLVA